jgi:taurine dioxygenase
MSVTEQSVPVTDDQSGHASGRNPVATFQHIDVVRRGGALGAEIRGVNIAEPISGVVLDEIYSAWLENHVIFFRDQTLTPQNHLDFARRFGDIHIHPFNKPLDDYREILEILKTEDMRQNNGARWHSDQMYTAQPAKGTMLYAYEMPPFGGDTQFSNLHLGYAALSSGMQQLLGGLKGVNNGDSRKHNGLTRREREQAGMTILPQKDPENVQTISVHPIVRTHPETGRKGLYFGSHTERFDGMTVAESKPLLTYLTGHATQPEFTFRLRWEVGTLTLWDNRCCQHFAINDYQGFRRRVNKITIAGDTPY